MTPDNLSKQLYGQLAQFLEQGLAIEKFVLNLKAMDSNKVGYLNEKMIQNAFHNTYKDMNRENVRLPELSDDQIVSMLRFVNRNKNGFCSYRELLI